MDMQKQEIIKRADQVCDGIFLFREHWEMEKTNIPYRFQGKMIWDIVPFGDPEWTYALNRHTCLVNLAKAYEITRDRKYTDRFVELAEDFIDSVPLTEDSRSTTWRSIEAGIRCGNWIACREILKDCGAIGPGFWQKYLNTLYRHGEYLYAVDNEFHLLSNWGILQNHGLLLLGLYFNERKWERQAIERLKRELHVQIFDDGMQWEQSPMYHCEVLHCLLDSIESLLKAGRAVPEEWTRTAKNMLYALGAFCKPNGHIPCQSDSDDIDATDMLIWGSRIFQGEEFHAEASKALTDSGNYILRSGKGREADYLRFHCGCMGSGHGHGDQLHVDLYSGGEDILIDSGRYTYVDSPERRRLKSPAAHNTVRVDDTDFSEYINSWCYGKMAIPLKGEYKFTQEADFVSAAHLGYLDRGIVINRKIAAIRPGIYVIVDECLGTGCHSYSQTWHFSGRGRLKEADKGITFYGDHILAKCFFLSGKHRIGKTDYSPEYNLLETAHLVTVEQKKEGSAFFYTVIILQERKREKETFAIKLPVSLAKKGIFLDENKAQALKICRGKEEYVLIFCHEEIISEVDLIEAGGYKGYGRVLLFSPENEDGICLQY